MSDRIRLLTDHGIQQFAAYLAAVREGSTAPPPFHLLTDPEGSLEAEVEGQIDQISFASRYELGAYLVKALSVFDQRLVSRNFRLWTWLGLYYFDQTCPVLAHGQRNPMEDVRHILPATYNWRKYYRHLVREAWLTVRMNGEIVRPLLAVDLFVRGELIEQLSSRQPIVSNPVIMGAVQELYISPDTGRLRRGTGGKAGGSPRRLVQVLDQLNLTFDLRASSPKQVVSLLPKEFDRWKSA